MARKRWVTLRSYFSAGHNSFPARIDCDEARLQTGGSFSDVRNQLLIVAENGHWKSKGAFVKELGDLDYDLSIVNQAVVDRLVKDIPIEDTISGCDELWRFQMVKRASSKYRCLMHGYTVLAEKTVRAFASKRLADDSLYKVHKNGSIAKVGGTPEHCRLVNGEVKGAKVPDWLDRQWYINLAYDRITKFIVKKENMLI